MVYSYKSPESLYRGHQGRVFLLLTLLWLLVSLTHRVLPPLIPAIIEDLSISAFLAGVSLTLEQFIRAVIEYPSGRAADQVSRTTVLLACMSFVIVGILVLAFATTYWFFLVGIVIFGVGHGMYSPASRALLSDLYRQKRGWAFGVNMVGSELAGIVGAGMAIVIVGYFTWRAAFLPIALILFPLTVGFAVLSREQLCLRPVKLNVADTAIRIFGQAKFRFLLVVYSLYVLAATGVSTFIPLFLIEVHSVSFAFASSAFALLYGVGIVAKPVSGLISDRIPRLHVAAGALAIGCMGLTVMILAPTATIAIAGVIVYAVGYRGVPPALQAFLMDDFPDHSMAGDLGAMRLVYLSIGALGPAYAGWVGTTLSFVAAFSGFAMVYLLSALLLVAVSRIVAS